MIRVKRIKSSASLRGSTPNNCSAVYLGASRDKYEQYCKALDSEKIKYKTKRVNHEEKMTAPGRGTVRSMGGNFGTDKTLYEIMVGEKDYDNAMGILTALK